MYLEQSKWTFRLIHFSFTLLLIYTYNIEYWLHAFACNRCIYIAEYKNLIGRKLIKRQLFTITLIPLLKWLWMKTFGSPLKCWWFCIALRPPNFAFSKWQNKSSINCKCERRFRFIVKFVCVLCDFSNLTFYFSFLCFVKYCYCYLISKYWVSFIKDKAEKLFVHVRYTLIHMW